MAHPLLLLQDKSSKKEPSTAAGGQPEKPAWGILRDDFMMGAQMKDWDKQEDEDADNEDDNDKELSSGDSDLDT